MIFSGKTGYVSGNLNQAVNTVLAMTAGPVKGRNWYSVDNPQYQIVFESIAATGVVQLQGTNTVALGFGQPSPNPVEVDILPTEGASWTMIATATAPTSISGTFSTEYEYLRLIISTQGTGYVLNAWTRWR
jgi:hypothetical protein